VISEFVSPVSGVRMQLKVCERCGILWCRVLGDEGRHCRGCVMAVARQRRESPVVLSVGRPVCAKGEPNHRGHGGPTKEHKE
jgi:hypothetical protein